MKHTEHITTNKPLECPVPHKQRKGMMVWIKRLGWAGFFFFLIKGLVWIAIFMFGAEAIKGLF
jgi:hypothetical protein